MLEKELSNQSLSLFKNRGNYDQIVLLDWATNESNLDKSKLNILKDVLTKVVKIFKLYLKIPEIN